VLETRASSGNWKSTGGAERSRKFRQWQQQQEQEERRHLLRRLACFLGPWKDTKRPQSRRQTAQSPPNLPGRRCRPTARIHPQNTCKCAFHRRQASQQHHKQQRRISSRFMPPNANLSKLQQIPLKCNQSRPRQTMRTRAVQALQRQVPAGGR